VVNTFKGLFGGTSKSLVLLAVGASIAVVGVAYAGRLAIRTSSEVPEKTKLIYVIEDSSGHTVREIREVVSPGNVARVVLRGLRPGTYSVTPYGWMAGGAWRSSVPVAETREVSVNRGVETVDFAIAGNGGGGGGGGTGEVQGWPNGIVWMNSTSNSFALPYSMKHPVHTGGVVKNYTFDAVIQPTQAGFNGTVPFSAGSALHSWSGTINVTTSGGNAGVAFAENVGTLIDPTTWVVEIAAVNGVFVARAPAVTAKMRRLSFEEIAPNVFVGSVEQ
jgi:hypothetical protein